MGKVPRATAIMSSLALFACSPIAPVEEPLASHIKAEVLKSYAGPLGPRDIQVQGMWHMRGDKSFSGVCGEFAAPEALKPKRETLRFIDDPGTKFVQVEYHELWVGNPQTMIIVEANRKIFDQLWDEHCAPFSTIRPWWKVWL